MDDRELQELQKRRMYQHDILFPKDKVGESIQGLPDPESYSPELSKLEGAKEFADQIKQNVLKQQHPIDKLIFGAPDSSSLEKSNKLIADKIQQKKEEILNPQDNTEDDDAKSYRLKAEALQNALSKLKNNPN